MAKGYYLTIQSTESNVDINNNTSDLKVTVVAHRPANATGAYTGSSTPLFINVDGTQKQLTVGAYDFRSSATITLGNATFTVDHNADGSKTANVSVSWNSGNSYVQGTNGSTTITASSNVVLSTIPRASKVTLDKSSATYGQVVSLTIEKAVDSFIHAVAISCNNDDYTIVAENVDTSYSYEITTDIANRLVANANNLTIRVITYNGDKLVGNTDNIVTITTPSSFAPTVTFSASDSKNLDSVFGGFVRNQSEVTVSSVVSLKYGASIVSHSISNGSKTVSNQATTNSVTYVDNGTTWTTKAKDSRGLETIQTYTPTSYDWYNPIISNYSFIRANADGTENDEGGYIKVAFDYDIAPINNKNTKVCKIDYRVSGEETWQSTNVSLSGYSGSASKVFSANVDNAYEVKLSIQDYFSTNSFTYNVSTAFTLLDFGANGKSIAIGKVSTNEENTLELQEGWGLRGFKTSMLNNDSNFVSGDDLSSVATSGSYNDLLNKPSLNRTILWSSTSTNFASQNITLSDRADNYDLIVAVFIHSASNPYNVINVLPNINGLFVLNSSYQNARSFSAYITQRGWRVNSDNTGWIGDAVTFTSYGSGTTQKANAYVLPRYIIGIKLGE